MHEVRVGQIDRLISLSHILTSSMSLFDAPDHTQVWYYQQDIAVQIICLYIMSVDCASPLGGGTMSGRVRRECIAKDVKGEEVATDSVGKKVVETAYNSTAVLMP